MDLEKPEELFDRDVEWRVLANVWSRPRPDLVFVIGRRRVGKSFLLTRFTAQVNGIYYQATRRTEAEQLAGLTRVIGERFGDPALQRGVSFPAWEDLFGYIRDHADGQPFMLVLDEFPYLAAAAPALPSVIQAMWDHDWRDTQLKLVLSGSYITAMNRLEHIDQPLYGRRTAKLLVSPFGFADAARFMPGYDLRDQLIGYGVFGHLPGHLALLDPSRSLGQNAAEAVLSPTGRLADDAQHMLDAFAADAHVHYSILDAIAAGEHTWKGITNRVDRSGGSLSRPLQWLEEMQVIARVVPITELNPQRSKRAVYRIVDPYVAFWHGIVSRLVNAGSIGLVEPERLWDEVVVPRLDDFMGPVFEDICRDFVRRTDRLPFAPMRVGEWWDTSSTTQIDVVAVGASKELLVGECKWGRVTSAHLAALRERAQLLPGQLGGAHPMHIALFSGRNDFDARVREAADAGGILLFSAEDFQST